MIVTKKTTYTITLEERTFKLLLLLLSVSWEELERMASGECANQMKQLELEMKNVEANDD